MFADHVGREGIENFVIDSGQSRLFTLHTKGAIEMFDISGTQFVGRGGYSNLKNDLISRGIAGNASSNAQTNVVHLAAIGAHESRRACLVAVTACGGFCGRDEADAQARVYISPVHRLPLSASAGLQPIHSISPLKHYTPPAPSSVFSPISAHPHPIPNCRALFPTLVDNHQHARILRVSKHLPFKNGSSRTIYLVKCGRLLKFPLQILL